MVGIVDIFRPLVEEVIEIVREVDNLRIRGESRSVCVQKTARQRYVV